MQTTWGGDWHVHKRNIARKDGGGEMKELIEAEARTSEANMKALGESAELVRDFENGLRGTDAVSEISPCRA